jgi:protease I
VLPGGVANGDLLRWQESARDFVRRFTATGRPLAVICHGGWILIDIDLVRGRHLTSWPSLATDYRNAGAQWSDEQLVVDTDGPFTIISSRKPADLPAFSHELVAQIEKG